MIREGLFEWFSILRCSVAPKTRIPPKLVFGKAAVLAADYAKTCLLQGKEPDLPVFNHHWMRGWRREYRISLRKPNWRFQPSLKMTCR